MTQQSYSRAYTQRKPQLEKIHESQCSLQHYLQQLGHGSNLMSTDRGMGKEDMAHICDGILLSHKNNTICNIMDGPRDYLSY